MTTQQVVRFSAAVMTTLLALVILWQFRLVVAYMLVSLTVAAALRPLVNRLIGQPIAVRLAWGTVYLLSLIGFGILLFWVGDTALGEIQRLIETVAAQDTWKLPVWLQGSPFQRVLVSWLPTPGRLFEAVIGEQGNLMLPALLGFTQGVVGTISAISITLFLSLYWIVDQLHFERLWLSLLPTEQRKQTRDIWRTIEPELGAYLRSQLVYSILAGILFGLGYWILRSPYPTLLALAGALACLLPVVGPVLAVILPLVVGVMASIELGIFAVFYTLLVLVVLETWLKPRLFSRRWENPILTLLILIASTSTFGLLGSMIAPPLSALFQILWHTLINNRIASGASSQISDLKERKEKLLAAIRAMEEPPSAMATSGIERLTAILQKAEPVLQSGLPPVEAMSSKRIPGD